MSQKELNYIEDIINHERLIIYTLQNNNFEDDIMIDFIENQISAHEKLTNKLAQLLEGCS